MVRSGMCPLRRNCLCNALLHKWFTLISFHQSLNFLPHLLFNDLSLIAPLFTIYIYIRVYTTLEPCTCMHVLLIQNVFDYSGKFSFTVLFQFALMEHTGNGLLCPLFRCHLCHLLTTCTPPEKSIIQVRWENCCHLLRAALRTLTLVFKTCCTLSATARSIPCGTRLLWAHGFSFRVCKNALHRDDTGREVNTVPAS